ncbi:hypothetical protein C8R45DRAFT_1091436 [Mycena sanguinolenta]|nr:hypothetical protein C8R45DRAFT_1091436 [Mycena sanguinolenta]
MAHTSSSAPTAATSEKELAALVTTLSKLSIDVSQRALTLNDKNLSSLGLEMTRHCLEITECLPRVLHEHVEAALAQLRPPSPLFYQGIAPTPAHMEEMFPPGNSESQTWHVVCVGRQPGLYATSQEADAQVLGVPDQSRRKVSGRAAALAYYRSMYETDKVMRLTEIAE